MAGRDGIGEQSQPARPGSPQPAGPSSWRGNGWLPLQAELVRGPAVVGRARELELLAAEAAQVGGSGLRAVIVKGEAGIGNPVGRVRAYSGGARPPYRRGAPMISADLYLRLSDFRGDDDPDTFGKREKLLRAEADRLGWAVHRVVQENDLTADGEVKPASAYKKTRAHDRRTGEPLIDHRGLAGLQGQPAGMGISPR